MSEPIGIGGDPAQRIASGHRRLGLLVNSVMVLLVIAGIVIATATLVSLDRLTSQSAQLESLLTGAADDRATEEARFRTTTQEALQTISDELTAIDDVAARNEEIHADIASRIEALNATLSGR
jgi:hypothetical protein